MSAWAASAVVREGRPGAGIRAGIAGASHWHLPRHAKHLAEAGVMFTGVSDPDAEIAARWARELGCPAAASVEELLDKAKPDVVLALGRAVDMAAQAQLLIDAGAGILAEKPLGIDAQEVEAVAQRAASKHAWLSVALVLRYDPLWDILDALNAQGTLGTIAHAHVRLINGPPRRYAEWGSSWMLQQATSGGGAMRNLGIHGVDFFHHLTGEAVGVAGAATTNRIHRLDVEEFGSLLLRSGSGVLGTIEAGYTYPDARAGMTRSGDNEIRVGAGGAYVIARDTDVWVVTAERGEEYLALRRSGDRYRDWVFDSLARWRDGRPALAGVDDCLVAMQVLDHGYKVAGR